MDIVFQAVLLVVGFVMLIKGADWFVEGASKIADRFGIPQLVIGLTIVAMGTSAPEAAVSLASALRGSAELTVGNVLGSNILNVLIILGLTATVRSIAVQKSTIKYEMPFVIIISALMGVLGLADGEISRIEGIILWALFLVYMVYLLIMAKKGQGAEQEEIMPDSKTDSMLKLIVLVIVGVVLIVWGSDITVDAATELATMFGMTERLIGLTIVALGTSLPELVTSVTAAIKGKADIAVGNVVGSNIFNILFVAGTTALITPVAYSASFMVDTVTAAAAVLLLWICVLPKKKLGRPAGILMLACYVAYFIYLIQ